MPKWDVRALEPGEICTEWQAFYGSPVNLTMSCYLFSRLRNYPQDRGTRPDIMYDADA
jgi:hypothetical protein